MTRCANLVTLHWYGTLATTQIPAFLAQRYTDGNKMGMQPVPVTLPTCIFGLTAADKVRMKFACNIMSCIFFLLVQ